MCNCSTEIDHAFLVVQQELIIHSLCSDLFNWNMNYSLYCHWPLSTHIKTGELELSCLVAVNHVCQCGDQPHGRFNKLGVKEHLSDLSRRRICETFTPLTTAGLDHCGSQKSGNKEVSLTAASAV